MAFKTQGPRAVCFCSSYGCNKFFFINSQGKRQQGVEISLTTKQQHKTADTINQNPQDSNLSQTKVRTLRATHPELVQMSTQLMKTKQMMASFPSLAQLMIAAWSPPNLVMLNKDCCQTQTRTCMIAVIFMIMQSLVPILPFYISCSLLPSVMFLNIAHWSPCHSF